MRAPRLVNKAYHSFCCSPTFTTIHKSKLRRLLLENQRGLSTISTVDEGSVLFPNERFGVNYATNWGIASLGVHVRTHAFYNVDISLLRKISPELDAEVLHFENADSSIYGSEEMLPETFDEILNVTREALSTSNLSGPLFLQDGFASEFPLRVVSDDPNYTRFFQHILEPVKDHMGPSNFFPLVQILHSSIPDDASPEPYCAVANGVVAIRGKPSLFALTKALTQAIGEATSMASFPGEVRINESNDEVILVVNQENSVLGDMEGTKVAAHGILVDNGQVKPAWNGAFVAAFDPAESQIQFLDYKLVQVQGLSPKPPDKIVFAIKTNGDQMESIGVDEATSLAQEHLLSSNAESVGSLITDNVKLYKI